MIPSGELASWGEGFQWKVLIVSLVKKKLLVMSTEPTKYKTKFDITVCSCGSAHGASECKYSGTSSNGHARDPAFVQRLSSFVQSQCMCIIYNTTS